MRHTPLMVVDAVWRMDPDREFRLYINPLLTVLYHDGEVSYVATFTDWTSGSDVDCGPVLERPTNYEFYTTPTFARTTRPIAEVSVHRLGEICDGQYELIVWVKSILEFGWNAGWDSHTLCPLDDDIDAVTVIEHALVEKLKRVKIGL